MATQQRRNPDNIRRYPKKSKITLTFIIFAFILAYVFYTYVSYLTRKTTTRYEVTEGSLASNSIYKGIVLRDEKMFTTADAGYVNYLAREGSRVSTGDLVYTVDETGALSEYLEAQSMGENTLTDSELNEFRGDLINFSAVYNAQDYDKVYDFKYTLKNTVLKLANTKLLTNIDSTSYSDAGNSIKYCYSSDTGIISYWYDGYEALDPSEITKAAFDEKEYDKTVLGTNVIHANDEFVYKLSRNENWSIVIPVEEEFGELLLEEQYVKVRFLKNQDESWGKVSLHHNEDGVYCQLSFTNSMVTFVSDRYLDIEVIVSEETGLKIPLSSIVEKEFFLIDENYIFEDEDDNCTVLMQTFNDAGERTATPRSLSVYSYDKDMHVYYVDESFLQAGDTLYKKDSQESFIVKTRGTLIGVYNINKGYADFKQISILYQNDEYAIVKSNTRYGLRVYDYIALNAASVEEDQFITN